MPHAFRLSSDSKSQASNSAGNIRKGRVSDFEKVRKVKLQIDQMRAKKNKHWRTTRLGRKRTFTVADLEQMAQERQKLVSNFGNKHELDKVAEPVNFYVELKYVCSAVVMNGM